MFNNIIKIFFYIFKKINIDPALLWNHVTTDIFLYPW